MKLDGVQWEKQRLCERRSHQLRYCKVVKIMKSSVIGAVLNFVHWSRLSGVHACR